MLKTNAHHRISPRKRNPKRKLSRSCPAGILPLPPQQDSIAGKEETPQTERWAGGAFVNSPPPSQLPIPSFCNSSPVDEEIEPHIISGSASPISSPTPPAKKRPAVIPSPDTPERRPVVKTPKSSPVVHPVRPPTRDSRAIYRASAPILEYPPVSREPLLPAILSPTHIPSPSPYYQSPSSMFPLPVELSSSIQSYLTIPDYAASRTPFHTPPRPCKESPPHTLQTMTKNLRQMLNIPC